jgi:hypothetical protein
MEVDGVGTLIVTATPSGGTAIRRTADNADMRPATAKYAVDVGCVPAGMVNIDAFLDDNGNAAPTAATSSDYRDSCGNPRSISAPITAGQGAEPAFALANSCD